MKNSEMLQFSGQIDKVISANLMALQSNSGQIARQIVRRPGAISGLNVTSIRMTCYDGHNIPDD
jgi:hypothetical protein